MTEKNPTPRVDPRLRDVLPRLTIEEKRALKSGIEEHGVLDPIKITPDGTILDGHHRFEIATKLGVEIPMKVLDIDDADEQLRFAVKTNFARRNLTTEQKREMVLNLRGRGLSVRLISKMTGIPKSTVGDIASGPRPVSDTAEPWATASYDEVVAFVSGLNEKPLEPIPDVREEAIERLRELGSDMCWAFEAIERSQWADGHATLEDLGGRIPTMGEAVEIARKVEEAGGEPHSPEFHIAVAQIASLFPLDSKGRRPRGLHLWECAVGAPQWLRIELGERWDDPRQEIVLDETEAEVTEAAASESFNLLSEAQRVAVAENSFTGMTDEQLDHKIEDTERQSTVNKIARIERGRRAAG